MPYHYIQLDVEELSQQGVTSDNLPERLYNEFIRRGYKVYEPFEELLSPENIPSSVLISGPSELPYHSDIDEIRKELGIYIFQSEPLQPVQQVYAMGRRMFTPFNGRWKEDDRGISKLDLGPVREGERRIEQLVEERVKLA